MKQPNFITLYKTLTTKETNAFTQYLNAFLPEDSIPLKIFAELTKGDLEEQLDRLRQEENLKPFYQKAGNLSKSFSNTLSDLQKELEDFLTAQKLKSNAHLRSQLLLDVFQEKKLERFADHLFIKDIKAIDKKESKDQNDYLHAFKLFEFHFYNSRTPKLDHNTGIEKCMEYLDLFFITNKFKIAAEMMNRQTFINDKTEAIQFLKNAEAFLKTYSLTEAPTSTLFYLAYLFNCDATISAYHKFKKVLFDHIDLLNKTNQNILLGYMINFTAREIRQGNSAFLKRVFRTS